MLRCHNCGGFLSHQPTSEEPIYVPDIRGESLYKIEETRHCKKCGEGLVSERWPTGRDDYAPTIL